MVLALIGRLEFSNGVCSHLCQMSPMPVSEKQWGEGRTPIKTHLRLMLFIDRSGSPGEKSESQRSEQQRFDQLYVGNVWPHTTSFFRPRQKVKAEMEFQSFHSISNCSMSGILKRNTRVIWKWLYQELNVKIIKSLLTILHPYTNLHFVLIIVCMDFLWLKEAFIVFLN